MANDGSIIIDTELDNSGFDKGSDKLLSAVKDLTGAVDNFSDNMMSSFQGILSVLQGIGNSTAQICAALTGTGEDVSAANAQAAASAKNVADAAGVAAAAVDKQDDAISGMGKSVDAVSGAAETGMNGIRDSAEQAAAAMGKAEQTARGLGAALGRVSAADLPKDLSGAEKACASLSGQLEKLSERAQLGFKNDGQLQSFTVKVDAAKKRIAELREQMASLSTQQVATPEYADMQVGLSKANAHLDKLIDKQNQLSASGVSESSKAYQALCYEIEQAKADVSDFIGTMQSMRDDGEAFVKVGDTAEFQKASAELDALAEKANALPTKAVGIQAFIEKLKGLGATIKSLPGQLARLSLEGLKKGLVGIAKLSFTGLKKSLVGIAKLSFTGLKKSLVGIAKISFTGLKKGLSGIGMAAKAVASGVKNMIGNLNLFKKHSKSAGISANGLVRQLTSLKTLLISRVKSAFISMLMENIRESMTELAKFSDSFNGAMSNMKNAMQELGANIAVTFAGIIEQIEPIITRVLTMMSDAMVKVNALLASLSGKKTMVIAKKQTESYAESMDDASESAEKLKNQVYGFDELNKRSGTQDESKDDKKKKDAGGDLYEEVPIDEAVPEDVLDVIQKIKDAIADGDWYGLGQMAAEGLNHLMQTIDDWINNVFRPKGVEWARNIAEFLNGLVDGLDWTLLGKTIADGLNAVADIINTFLTTFNFENLGSGIGEAINGFFGNVEWDLIGQTFANGWNAVIDLIYGLVTTVDFSSIGDSLAEFFNNFFFTVDWDKASEAIVTGLNGIIEAFQHFIDGVDWNAVGSTIGGALDTLLNGFDWDGAGKLIGSAIDGLIDVIFDAINSIDWVTLGSNVASGFMQLWNAIDWAGTGKKLSDALLNILNGISTTLKEIDWQKLGSDVAAFIAAIDWSGITTALFDGIGAALGGLTAFLWGLIKDAWDDMLAYFAEYTEQCGGDAVAGFFVGIGNAFVNVGKWIKENIFDPFINGFKDAFGIHSPSTEMMVMGDYLVEGLLAGIRETWESITGFFSEKLGPLKETISKGWETIQTDTKAKWDKITSTIGNAWDSIKTTTANKWNGLKSDVSSKWENLKNTLKRTDWKDIGSNLVNGLKQGISNAWHTLTSTVSSLANSLTSKVKSLFGIASPSKVWAEIGQYLDAGLEKGIEAGEKSAVSTVSNLAKSVNAGMQLDAPEMGDMQLGTVSGLDAAAGKLDGFIDRLKAIADTLASIGGLSIPAVAAGTDVPYRLRTNTAGGTDNAGALSDGFQTVVSDQNEFITEVMYLLRQILGAVNNKKLAMDAGSIAEMVSSYQQNRERSFGGI